MMTTEEILYNNKLNPETKVYQIARLLHNENKLDDNLWYAILDLKEKYFSEIQNLPKPIYFTDRNEVNVGNKLAYMRKNNDGTYTIGYTKSLGMYNFTKIYDDEHPIYEQKFSTKVEAMKAYKNMMAELKGGDE